MENKKYVLISGATSGFGRQTAKRFAADGWNLVLTGRRMERLVELKKELEKSHPDSKTVVLCFDIRNEQDVNSNVSGLDDKVKEHIEILVNNAGLALGRSPIDAGNTSDWDQMLDTNVKGLLYLTKAVVPYMKANKKGHIVNISSIAGKEVYADGNVYCASKHAVDALSKAMRIDLLPFNIKVTNIAPGAANTEFSLVRFKGDQEIANAVYNGFEPLIAEDIANTIFYVCNLPAHVTINDLTIMPTAQASSTVFHKV